MEDLRGRTAIVTGGSRGIGYAIAGELLRRGAVVTVTGRHADQLDEAAASLASDFAGGDPSRVVAAPGRVDAPEARTECIERTMAAFGRVDILVNNAGINPVYGPLTSADLSAVRKIFDVNVIAPVAMVQLVHEAWMGDHGGSVVNIASTGGLRTTGAIAAYGASKAALIRLTEELATELGPKIRVNAVAPAVVKTRFAAALYEGNDTALAASYPMRRLGVPEDVAAAVGFLVSDAASWITGETLRVDGGTLASGRVTR